MLYAINIENAHEYGDALAQLYKLRFRQFKARQSYDVPAYKDMEYDQYDTLATVNLVWIDEDGLVRGCSRLNPTDRPYMLKDLWPEMADDTLPEASTIWEGTRICIDKSLPGALRERVKREIVMGYMEFGLANGIDKYIGVMMNFIWRRVFIQSGWEPTYLGGERLIDGLKTRAGMIQVSPKIHQILKEKTDTHYKVLQNDLRVDLGTEAVEALAS